MSRELLISVAPGETRAVLAENGGAVELHVARLGEGSRIGEIHLGRVVRLLPDLPAALIDIGAERPAFLSGEDAVDAAPPDKRAAGIAAWLSEGQAVLVQITRDAQGDKAIGVSLRLRLAGRLLTLTPTRSKHVLPPGSDADQRARLNSLLPAGEGAILLPAALAAERETLHDEIAALQARWVGIRERARPAKPPCLVEAVEAPVVRLLAGIVDAAPERILIDDRAAFAACRRWLLQHRPELVSRLAHDSGSDDIFERHGVAGDLDAAMSRRVALPPGGSLIIDTVAAMSVIDVDSGAAVGGRQGAPRAALAVNLAAARVAARQIRLRNLAGAIVIDFISMRSAADRTQVLAALAAALAGDPAEPQILGWTRLGHVELTRRRTSRPLAEILFDASAGEMVKSSRTIALEALRAAARQAAAQPGRTPTVIVHPEIAATLAGAAAGALRELGERLALEVPVTVDPGRSREAFDIRLD
ncbi:MAG: ribonuclease [Rhodospirillales bacterium]|nr:ribonuclease [Rhodospirillales bacterium]